MHIQAIIIDAGNSQRVHEISIADGQPGLTTPLVRLAEQEALEWAQQQGKRVVGDVFSQGAYRAWVTT